TPSLFTASWEENILRTQRQLHKPLDCTVEAARRIAPRSVGVIVFREGWEYLVQRALLRGLDRAPRFVPSSRHREIRPRRLEAADLILGVNGSSEDFPTGGVSKRPTSPSSAAALTPSTSHSMPRRQSGISLNRSQGRSCSTAPNRPGERAPKRRAARQARRP